MRKFRFTNSDVDFTTYKTAKNRFKNVCRFKRLKLEKSKRKELMNASKNPKQYWRLIKQNCNKTRKDMTPSVISIDSIILNSMSSDSKVSWESVGSILTRDAMQCPFQSKTLHSNHCRRQGKTLFFHALACRL